MKFFLHKKTEEKTWKDFVFEVKNYFEECIDDLKVTTLENLKNLMIVDLLKRRMPLETKEHFRDEWSTIIWPAVLVELVDKYENIRRFKKKATRQDNNASK